MINTKLLSIAVAIGLLAGCAAVEIQGEFSRGRQALLGGDAAGALEHFERVAQNEPHFQNSARPLYGSIWTYIGRARYQSGQYREARHALEKALAQHKGDHIGRLYLGLVLAREPVAAAKTTEFSVQDVSFALREGVEPERVAALVRERGVAFDLSKEVESQLRKAGADGTLLEAIKKARAETARKNESQKARAATELTAAATALRDDLGAFAATAEGRFWDPSGQIRQELQSMLALLSARTPDWDKIVTAGEWLGTKLEEEIDRARRDEQNFRRRQPAN